MEHNITFQNEQFTYITGTDLAYVSQSGRIVKANNSKVKELFGATDSMGYIHFRFKMLDGSVKLMKLHRIVMMTFNPHPDANKLVVDHVDEQKQNNNLHNLRWITRGENTALFFKNRREMCEPCFSPKLTDEQIELIRAMRFIKLPIATIAKEMGTNWRRVSNVLKNTTGV